MIGIEHDKSACETRHAAGHLSIRADIANYPTGQFRGRVTGLIASPPCTDFSVAGARAGLSGKSGNLVYEVPRWANDLDPDWIACEQVPAVMPLWKEFANELSKQGYNTWTGILNAADFGVPQIRKRAILMASKRTFNPPKQTHAERPEPEDLFGDPLLPWVTMAEGLGWGLLERPSTSVVARGHDADGNPTGGSRPLDGGSGARAVYEKALENGAFLIRTRGDRKTSGGNLFSADEPSWTVTEKTRSWNFDDQERAKVLLHGGGWSLHNRLFDPDEEPSPAVMFGHDASNWQWRLNTGRDWKEGGSRDDAQVIDSDQPAPSVTGQAVSWIWQRPATTVVSAFRPMIIAAPGWRVDPHDSRQDAEGSIRVTVDEAGVLQSFPWNYPWQGSTTKKYEQIGNACPPFMAAAILNELL